MKENYVIITIGDNMKKVVLRVLVVIFAFVAIFVTLNLLAYNDYEVAEFGNKSFVLVDDELQKYGYKKGDLLVVSSSNKDSIKVGDSILYYDSKLINGPTVIKKGTVEEVSDNAAEFYVLNSDSEKMENSVKNDRVIGVSDSVKTYPVIGGVLSVLEARTGYLLIILLPTLVLFAYLIRKTVVEIKEEKKN